MSADTLQVTLVQATLVWQNAEENHQHLGELLKDLEGKTDLVVLPETFASGFNMEPRGVAQPADGLSFRWMQQQAAKLQAVVTGSLVIEEAGLFYNRMFWVRPDGTFAHYNKRHLFRMAGEDKQFSAGTERVHVSLLGWEVCLQVCYDLRFPVFSRNRQDNRYDLMLYVANWPAVRSHPWSSLLMARAIENQAYVVGVNRVGVDGNNIAYSGDSAAIDAKGNYLAQAQPGAEEVITVTLSRSALDDYRQKFPQWMDADDFDLSL